MHGNLLGLSWDREYVDVKHSLHQPSRRANLGVLQCTVSTSEFFGSTHDGELLLGLILAIGVQTPATAEMESGFAELDAGHLCDLLCVGGEVQSGDCTHLLRFGVPAGGGLVVVDISLSGVHLRLQVSTVLIYGFEYQELSSVLLEEMNFELLADTVLS
ncbi:hypothetical protein Mapa_009646 [Marchantia paleacea]|nr:hypothetical protein Mapa_009646 [Marchantia paleacea]